MLVLVDPFINCALLLASLNFLFSQHLAFNFKRFYSCLYEQRCGKGNKIEVEKKTKETPFIFCSTTFLGKRSLLCFQKAILLQKHRERQLHLPAFLKCFPEAAQGKQ